MAQAIMDPEEVRRFAEELTRFNTELQELVLRPRKIDPAKITSPGFVKSLPCSVPRAVLMSSLRKPLIRE